jgi:hypothetical protein
VPALVPGECVVGLADPEQAKYQAFPRQPAWVQYRCAGICRAQPGHLTSSVVAWVWLLE